MKEKGIIIKKTLRRKKKKNGKNLEDNKQNENP